MLGFLYLYEDENEEVIEIYLVSALKLRMRMNRTKFWELQITIEY